MAAFGSPSTRGVPPFQIHPGHAFEGFELVECPDASPVLLARCDCGMVLDVADVRYARCPDCSGRGTGCMRCGGRGRVIDHAALAWRVPGGQNVP